MKFPIATRLVLELLLSGTAVAAAAAATTSARTDRPNVVIMLADDQGWGDLSLNGNHQLKTPRIDALARQGARLDRFFVCPVCAPTRAEFLTGRYHPRGGVRGVSTGEERLNLDERTLADAFLAAGYATAAFGKWHNGSQWPYHPNARGFQEYYGFTSGHWGEYFDPPLEHNGEPVRGKGFIIDDLTNHAVRFIEANRDRPFLCYLPYNTPHSPFCAPRSDWDRFRDAPITQRGSDGDRETIDVTRAVLAMCENIDRNVGRVLDKLDQLQLSDNTIVIYFSDNGPNSTRWNGGMKGRKGTTDEGGVRVPCLIRWPGRIPAGKVVESIAGAIDLLPTLTNLCGVTRVGDKPLDGRDLAPLLVGESRDWPDRVIFTHQNGNVSARNQRFRLDQRGALFDMIADPGQTRNVAAAHPETAQRLKQEVADWKAEVLPRNADDRPFPIGYREFPRTWLPARDGVAHGGIRRSAPAPNCSYFVNWTRPEDSMTWDVEVHESGRYEVTLHYTCPVGDENSVVELSFGGAVLQGAVKESWNPPLITDQDVIARPAAESTMKEFRALPLGTVQFEKGRGVLTLRAPKIAGKTVMDLRGITLTLKTQ